MSVDRIKQEAKRLSKLLPEHIKTHKDPSALAPCRELVSKIKGYASFHAAFSKSERVELIEEVSVGIPAIEADKSFHSGAQVERRPWDLTNEPYCQGVDSAQLSSGSIAYGGELTYLQYTGRYLVVDFGFDEISEKPLTALVFDPLYRADCGLYDFNLLLNRDEIRLDVANRIVDDIRSENYNFQQPDIFILVVHKGQSRGNRHYALCFDFSRIKVFCSRAAIEIEDFEPLYVDLKNLGVLRPYGRFVVRDVLRALQTYQANFEQCIVKIRSDRYLFQKMLDFMSSTCNVVEQGRSFGLNMNLSESSWLLESLADVARFDEKINIVLSNISYTLPQKKTPVVKPNGIFNKGIVNISNFLKKGATKFEESPFQH